MRRFSVYFLFFLAVVFVGQVHSQDTIITWLDASFNEISKDRAGYFRKGWEADGKWMVEDYFITGQLQMSGSFVSADSQNKHGHFVFYGENGNKITEGNFENGYLVGIWTAWGEDGSLSEKGTYFRPSSKGPKTIGAEERVKEQLNLPLEELMAFKTGDWEYYHANGTKSGHEVFEKGRLISASYWNEDGSDAGKDAILERAATFPGGMDKLMRYLQNNIKYPKPDKKKRIEGIVYVQFTVDMEGKVINARIVQSVSQNMDAEALRVVNSMPHWQPAIRNNRRMSMVFNLPVQFLLR